MEDQLSLAQKHKEEGNSALKANQFEKAIEKYSEAINVALEGRNEEGSVPNNKISIYYANRAFSHIKLQNYGLAMKDAEESVKLNPNYQKGYLRLAFTKELLQQYKDAYNCYKKLFELSGNKDQALYAKLVSCKKANEEHLKNKREQMLHDDKERGPPKEKPYKSWKEIEVESTYTGPKLEETGEVTSEWVVKLMEYYKAQKHLHKRYTLQLIEKCKDILTKYQTVVEYKIKDDEEITVCGDIHGQYYDMVNIFALNGNPSENNKYLFNGDFVDRGSFSVEVIMTMIAWKCADPDFLHMTRGNHEAKQVNMVYGFKGEVEAKFKDLGVYEAFSEMFCALPLSYVINSKVMICHGGLPAQDGVNIQTLKAINRFTEPPERGNMCDLLWADPAPQLGRTPSKRGCSMAYGPDITKKFLDDNGLELLIRSHEVKQEGYEQAHDNRCVTIFSAPNYCDFTGNQAAFIRLKGSDMKPKFTQFSAVPHPNVGPMAYANQFKGMC